MTTKDRDAPTIECEGCGGFGTIITDVYGPMMWREVECPLCGGAGRESAVIHPREPSSTTHRKTEKTNVTS